MGMNEEIASLNKRIDIMTKKQEEVSRLLAVEEHKIREIVGLLNDEGYDVESMTEESITKLIDQLGEKFTATKDLIDEKLNEVEEMYEQLSDITQKG